jgi:aryl-alcohol dehydrogenase-like predicted oxidoreductase
MKHVRLGRSGLKVSRVCLGTNMFGAGYVDDQRAVRVIRACLDHGVNFIDTADVYHAGQSEVVVGKGIRHRRHDYVVATKAGYPMGTGPNDTGLSRKHLVQGVEASLRRLGTDYIDLFQVHRWDPDTPIEETLAALDSLVKMGSIRYIGCSNFAAKQLSESLGISERLGLERFVSVQPPYNFSERSIEAELLPLCLKEQVAVLPYQVLMGGVLTGAYRKDQPPPADSHLASKHALGAKQKYWDDKRFDMVERIKAIARELGHEPTQVVIAWVLSKPAVTSPVVGASTPEQVAKNAASTDIVLPPDVVQRLDAL